MKLVKMLFFLSLFVGSQLLGMENEAIDKKSSSLQNKIVYIAKNIAAIGACLYLPTLFHELGHALAAKILINSPIKILLFMPPSMQSQEQFQSLLSVGNIHVMGLNAFNCVSQAFYENYDSASYWKCQAIGVSGPLCGMFSIGLIAYLCHKANALNFIAQWRLLSMLSIDFFDNLMPTYKDNDGYGLLLNYTGSAQYCDSVVNGNAMNIARRITPWPATIHLLYKSIPVLKFLSDF